MTSAADPGRVIVITGAMAAGKSTVAQLLADQLERSAHVRGDVFRRMVVGGRVEMTPDPAPEAVRQLQLRHTLAAATADAYAAVGFTAVVHDVILGAELTHFVARLRCPRRHVVVLAPTAAALDQRERTRRKHGYGPFTAGELDRVLREETPHIGYWLDSTHQYPAETVADILDHLEEAAV